jgi:hypothetical protein
VKWKERQRLFGPKADIAQSQTIASDFVTAGSAQKTHAGYLVPDPRHIDFAGTQNFKVR